MSIDSLLGASQNDEVIQRDLSLQGPVYPLMRIILMMAGAGWGVLFLIKND